MKSFGRGFCVIGLLLVCITLSGKLFFTNLLTDSNPSLHSIYELSIAKTHSPKTAGEFLVEENDPEDRVSETAGFILQEIIQLYATFLQIRPVVSLQQTVVTDSLFVLWSAPPLFILFQQQKSFLS